MQNKKNTDPHRIYKYFISLIGFGLIFVFLFKDLCYSRDSELESIMSEQNDIARRAVNVWYNRGLFSGYRHWEVVIDPVAHEALDFGLLAERLGNSGARSLFIEAPGGDLSGLSRLPSLSELTIKNNNGGDFALHSVLNVDRLHLYGWSKASLKAIAVQPFVGEISVDCDPDFYRDHLVRHFPRAQKVLFVSDGAYTD